MVHRVTCSAISLHGGEQRERSPIPEGSTGFQDRAGTNCRFTLHRALRPVLLLLVLLHLIQGIVDNMLGFHPLLHRRARAEGVADTVPDLRPTLALLAAGVALLLRLAVPHV